MDSVYPESERRVFGPVFNGADLVMVDPLAAYRRLLLALDGDLDGAVKEWYADQEEGDTPANRLRSLAAEERLMEASRSAFGMAPFDPAPDARQRGATDDDCKAALLEFLRFFHDGSTPAGSSPTPSAGE